MSERGGALVASTRGAIARALAHVHVAHAEALCESILETKKCVSPEDLQTIIDNAKAVKLAGETLKAIETEVFADYEAAKDVAKSMTKPKYDLFKKAMEWAKRLYEARQEEIRREERARKDEEARVEREAQAARDAAVAKGDDVADDLPPEASVFVPQAPALVRGGIGGMTETKRTALEVTDWLAAYSANPSLFDIKLRQVDAKRVLKERRAADPSYQLVGVVEKEVTSTSLL